MKILLVEDEADLAEATKRLLEKNGYVVDLADSLTMAKVAMLDNKYEVVLLDRRLPDGNGTDLIKYAERKHFVARFLIVSALSDLHRRVEGLDLGADDYIVKPFEPEDLLARIRAAERRPIPALSRIIEFGNLRLNCDTKNFRINGEIIVLPRREMVALQLFITHAGKVVTRESIESALYGYDEYVQSNTLESHVSRLRKKLSSNNAGVSIHTVRGVGYLLDECK